MSRIHAGFDLVDGLWPLLHLRSFEAVFGPKTDRWLARTVSGLLVSAGTTPWRAATREGWPHARRLGVTTATTLLAIDLVHVPRGTLRWTYLIDAAAETALLAGWARASRASRRD